METFDKDRNGVLNFDEFCLVYNFFYKKKILKYKKIIGHW